jgi:hypothetical protein
MDDFKCRISECDSGSKRLYLDIRFKETAKTYFLLVHVVFLLITWAGFFTKSVPCTSFLPYALCVFPLLHLVLFLFSFVLNYMKIKKIKFARELLYHNS